MKTLITSPKTNIGKPRLLARLLRMDQWYKNLIIFLPLLFAPEQAYPLLGLTLGFLGFSFASSVTYMINDWIDREKDQLHPIKKNRPLASGKISANVAWIIGILLALAVVGISLWLGGLFGWIVLTYFLLTNLYSFGLKHIPLLDIAMIGANFCLRMGAGMKTLAALDTLPYFGLLAGIIVIFLTHKRRSDIKLMGEEKAFEHKPVLRFYTKRNNYFFRAVAYAMVIGSFYGLWQKGFHPSLVIGLMIQLVATSGIFSDNPEFTSKPQWLLKSKLWDACLLANAVMILYFWLK